jgi:hypothetical protein
MKIIVIRALIIAGLLASATAALEPLQAVVHSCPACG